MEKKRLRRAQMYIALVAALPIAIGACSSSGSSSPAAASSAQAASGSTSGTAQSGIVKFALCMRKNGVTNFPDPTNGHFLMSSKIQSNPHFKSAFQTCQHLMGASGTSTGNTAQQQAELSFVHCMQTSGVPSYPDPASNGALIAPPAAVRNTATYKNAYSKCKSKLPGSGAGLGG